MSSATKIKIFVDAHSFDKEHQGIRSFIKRLYIALSEHPGYELYFGASNIENLKAELSEIPGARFVRYRFKSTLMRLLVEVPFHIKRLGIDYAHFQYISPLIKGCRTIVTTHDVLFLDFKSYFPRFYRISREFLFRYSIRRSDIKTTVSEYSRQRIEYHFKIQAKHIHILPNGVDSSYFRPYDPAISRQYVANKFRAENYILYVSRFEPRKNHLHLLRAYTELQLHKQNICLVLVGHNSLPVPEFTEYYKSLETEIKRHITIIPSADIDDLYHLYRGARALVYPSLAEGFGLPPIEAAALQIPVICSNHTAMSDFSFFNQNHINMVEKELLKKTLQKLLATPSVAPDLEKIAGEIERTYTFDLAVKRFLAALKEDQARVLQKN